MSPRRGLMWGGNILPGVTHPAWFYRPFGTFLKISNTNYKPSIIKLSHISFFTKTNSLVRSTSANPHFRNNETEELSMAISS